MCLSLHGCMDRWVSVLSVCICRQDSRRRKKFRDHTGNRITLEAVLNTTCSKCGCKGTTTKQQSYLKRTECRDWFLFYSLLLGNLLEITINLSSSSNTSTLFSGHFTKDCFSAPGLQYALVPEDGDEEPQQQQQQTSTVAPQRNSDKKKKKKKVNMSSLAWLSLNFFSSSPPPSFLCLLLWVI